MPHGVLILLPVFFIEIAPITNDVSDEEFKWSLVVGSQSLQCPWRGHDLAEVEFRLHLFAPNSDQTARPRVKYRAHKPFVECNFHLHLHDVLSPCVRSGREPGGSLGKDLGYRRIMGRW